jgi:hypothetical protein
LLGVFGSRLRPKNPHDSIHHFQRDGVLGA